ncbi:MAG: hypothetical protein K8T20_13475 [Planctomycetes bacterium]|nr:hypothetical protein [Planctomycetota bacterium]
MSSILMGWELGGGHGHVRTLLPIARALAREGHTPVFAVRDVVGVWPVLKGEGFQVVPAPYWPARMARLGETFCARSFADILAYFGWAEPEELESMVRAWDEVIDLVRPALVVLDFSPALSLATWGRLPVVGVGSGFTNPPSRLTQYPVLDIDAPTIRPEADLLASMAEVQRRRRAPAPASLAATLGHGTRFLTTLPELDPYRTWREGRAVGPMGGLLSPLPPPPSPRWFGYFTAERKDVEQVLLGLAGTGVPGEAYVRGAAAPLVASLRAAGIEIHKNPAPIDEVMARVSVVAHTGGIGLTSAALSAGRPQVLFPEQLEQRLTAGLLAGLGVGLTASEKEPGAAALRRVLKGQLFTMDAQERAADIRARGPWSGLERVMKACSEFVERE